LWRLEQVHLMGANMCIKRFDVHGRRAASVMQLVIRYLALILAFGALAPAPASASLIGDTVIAKFYSETTLIVSDTFVAGVGAEAACPGASSLCTILPANSPLLPGSFTLDFGANTISWEHVASTGAYPTGTFVGWVFSDLNFGAAIAAVTLDSSGISGLDASRVSFTADSISLNLQGVTVSDPNRWTLTVAVSETPLPAALPLFATGLGALGLLGWRRKRKAKLAV
jgi:hypothetical protein